jgi:hypothetical protein
MIRDGFSADLDSLRALRRDSQGVLAAIETRERQRTGISSLKVRYNKVFGYSIEVSNANRHLVPADYVRKQTLVGGERYITPELKELEHRVLTAEERIVALEYDAFVALREAVAAEAARLRSTAAAIATLDTLLSLALAATDGAWVRPRIVEEPRLAIAEGRHPVVERLLRGERFVPNDCTVDAAERQILILTGPNMGGKSTYLRQVALVALLAQTGSFVPAAAAEVGLVDRIFSRVGASDNLARGQSTFLVEMNETANILNNATARSLILLDEVGRGTSTFDGLSIAWSVAEHLHDTPRVAARTLFATHYHELTELALTKKRVVNLKMLVREWNDSIVFLRKVVEGSADRSYGIQVARLAGLPKEVLDRAREILANLEREELARDGRPKLARHSGDPTGSAAHEPAQIGLFAPEEDPVIGALRDASLETMTPIEAMNFLAGLKDRLGRCEIPAGAAAPPGDGRISEAVEGVGLVAENLEDLLQPGQDQQVLDLSAGIEELQPRPLLGGALVAGDQLADPGAVHVGHAFQVEDHGLPTLVEQGVHRLAQLDVAVADGDLAGQVDDRDLPLMPDARLHLFASAGCRPRAAGCRFFSSRTSVPFPGNVWNETLSTKFFMKKMPRPLVRSRLISSRGSAVWFQSNPRPWSRIQTRKRVSLRSNSTSTLLLSSIRLPCLTALM